MQTIFGGPWQMRDGGWSAPDVGSVAATLDLSGTAQHHSGNAGDGPTERGCGLWAADCDPSAVPAEYTVFGTGDWSEITLDATARDAWQSLFNSEIPAQASLQQACCLSLLDNSDPTGEGLLPLWPTRDSDGHYYLTVSFGGSTYRERFGRGHAHALARWVPAIHRELRRMWSADPVLCAEWLGWLFHEIASDTGVPPDPATTLLIPSDLRSAGLQPAPFHTEFSDNFNDGNLTGWDNWQLSFDNPGSTCRKTGVDANYLVFSSPLSGSNHYSQAKCLASSSVYVGLCVRRSTTRSLNDGYMGYVRSSDNTYRLARYVGGISTQIGSAVTAFVSGDTLLVGANGSTINMQRNGALQVEATDTAYPVGNYCGLQGFSTGGQYDDWVAADIVTATARACLSLGISPLLIGL